VIGLLLGLLVDTKVVAASRPLGRLCDGYEQKEVEGMCQLVKKISSDGDGWGGKRTPHQPAPQHHASDCLTEQPMPELQECARTNSEQIQLMKSFAVKLR
jgi:hypothetical protein